MQGYTVSSFLLIALVMHCSVASIQQNEEPPCYATKKNNPYYLPDCDKDGFFKALQIEQYGFYCFTRNGQNIPVSYTNPMYFKLGPCKTLKYCVKRNQAQGAQEHKQIRCDKYGYFKSLQRTKPARICVDPYGNFRKTSGVYRKRDCDAVTIVSAL